MLYKDHSLKIASPEILKKITRKDKTIRHCEELQRRGNLLFQQEIASPEFLKKISRKDKTIRHCEELQRRGNLLFQQEIASSEFTGRSLAKTFCEDYFIISV